MGHRLLKFLETTQMIVPEVDLALSEEAGMVRLNPVPITDWHYYFDAMDCAGKLLVEELNELPDVDAIQEVKFIVEDLESLVVSLRVFYTATMDQLDENRNITDEQIERFSRYRRTIDKRKSGEES